MLQLSWSEIFVPTHSIVEMIVRGTIMYLGIFTLMRFILKRQTGGLSIPDLLLVVLLADAAQNGMAVNTTRSQKVSCSLPPSFSGILPSTGSGITCLSWSGLPGRRRSSSSRTGRSFAATCDRNW